MPPKNKRKAAKAGRGGGQPQNAPLNLSRATRAGRAAERDQAWGLEAKGSPPPELQGRRKRKPAPATAQGTGQQQQQPAAATAAPGLANAPAPEQHAGLNEPPQSPAPQRKGGDKGKRRADRVKGAPALDQGRRNNAGPAQRACKRKHDDDNQELDMERQRATPHDHPEQQPPNGLQEASGPAPVDAPQADQDGPSKTDKQKSEKYLQEKMERIGYRSRGKIKAMSENVGHWTFAKIIGSGGFGYAALWLKYDKDGNIIDRSVLKDNYLEEEQYTNPATWNDVQRTIPREAALQRLAARNKAQNWSIVKCVTWGVYDDLHMYRIYTEFCPQGDLYRLMQGYANLDELLDEHGKAIKPRVPVLIVACVFESLAAAACLLQDGVLTPDKPCENWPGEIIHCDIKPNNIFLGEAESEEWPMIPRPKLGDFGIAVHAEDSRWINPEDYVGRGTPGWMAPEMMKHTDDPTLDDQHLISSAANIYSIGLVMWDLMQQQKDEQVRVGPYEQLRLSDGAKAFYPSRLVKAVELCLEPLPDKRVGARELFRGVTMIVDSEVPVEEGSNETLPFKKRKLPGVGHLPVKSYTYGRFARQSS